MFVCNMKSFAIAFLALFLVFLLISVAKTNYQKFFLPVFYHLLLWKHVTRIGHILLDTLVHVSNPDNNIFSTYNLKEAVLVLLEMSDFQI